MANRTSERLRMVESQIVQRGIEDTSVIAAMKAVPRHLFVPPDLASSAYIDGPIPIGGGQTISQPYVVALMAEALRLGEGEKVLEIGAGSGYAAAVLSQIASEVIAIERLPRLVDAARRSLRDAGCDNVRVYCDDGSDGWPDDAPYDAILVSAGAPEVPQALQDQLKVGACLVVPVGATRSDQTLLRVTRTGSRTWQTEDLGAVHFVPLIGSGGWREHKRRPGD